MLIGWPSAAGVTALSQGSWRVSVATVSCTCMPGPVINEHITAKANAMNIQQRRLEKGWSQEELARHSGLSTRTIQRIESGQNAGLESLKCLAAVFETSISTLMEEQTMRTQGQEGPAGQPMINKIERDAIEFAQSLVNEPPKGQPDSLTEIERKAIAYAKDLLKMFKT